MRAYLRRPVQHLASFVAVERPYKDKIRPTSPVIRDCGARVSGTTGLPQPLLARR